MRHLVAATVLAAALLCGAATAPAADIGANDDSGKYDADGGAASYGQMVALGLRQVVIPVRFKPSDPMVIQDKALLDRTIPAALAAGTPNMYARALPGALRPDGPVADFDVTQVGFYAEDRLTPVSNLTLKVGPGYERVHESAQYLMKRTDPYATATFGTRNVFGRLDQTTVSANIRVAGTSTMSHLRISRISARHHTRAAPLAITIPNGQYACA